MTPKFWHTSCLTWSPYLFLWHLCLFLIFLILFLLIVLLLFFLSPLCAGWPLKEKVLKQLNSLCNFAILEFITFLLQSLSAQTTSPSPPIVGLSYMLKWGTKSRAPFYSNLRFLSRGTFLVFQMMSLPKVISVTNSASCYFYGSRVGMYCCLPVAFDFITERSKYKQNCAQGRGILNRSEWDIAWLKLTKNTPKVNNTQLMSLPLI